jgi:hypothetical protein
LHYIHKLHISAPVKSAHASCAWPAMTKLLKHLAVELDLDSDLDFGSMDAGSELDERDLDLTEVRFRVH